MSDLAPHDVPTSITLLDAFRALVRREIEAELKRDGYHKRFEGQISYTVTLPPVVDWTDMPDPLQRQPEMAAVHQIDLYSYIIGPSRTYRWQGETIDAVFAEATKEFTGWVEQAARERAEDGDG